MKKIAILLCLAALSLSLLFSQRIGGTIPETLISLELIEKIMNEVSGDLALQNEIFLAGVNRNRLPEEYLRGPFEADFILKKLKEYGISDSEIIDLPTKKKTTWDAEMGELWTVEPEKMKIADLKEIAASLCEGSATSDATAELVYVGPGSLESYYKGKNVKGKIVLVNSYPEGARRLAVEKYGALGIVAYSSSHPEFDPNEVGWGGIDSGEKEKKSFAFMISTRKGEELRDLMERGVKIVVRAVCKAQMVPFKEQMVSGLLQGKDYPQEELVFTAHLFEGFDKQGANDDVSGCVVILETARAIKKLMDEGGIPALKRSIRFLFVPEISGTSAYLKKYPEIAKRFFANINEDMVGEALIKNNAYLSLVSTPYSLPSYLNDVMASFVEWMGKTQRLSFEYGGVILPIVSPTGTRDPFYCAVDPYSGGSDHVVFVDGSVRVPAVMLLVWPDMWYHSSGDTPDKSDSTQLKRVGFISTAAALFLANAGPQETEIMMAVTSARSLARLGQDGYKAERTILGAKKENLHTVYREARNVVNQAFLREKAALSSIRFFIKSEATLENSLKMRLKRLDDLNPVSLVEIEDVYNSRCQKEGLKPQAPSLTKEEIRLSGLIPVRTSKMGDVMSFWEMREKNKKTKYREPMAIAMAQFELRNFIDGKRSVLDIRNATSAEHVPLSLKDVEDYMNYLESLGQIEIKKR